METIGRYELIEEIGSGGMGVVYRALDTSLDREVALKLLPPQIKEYERFAPMFQREARIIAQLEHPHIVPVYDVGLDEKRPFLVMRLLRGGTLRDKMSQGALTLQQLWQIMQQVAQGLDTAHSQGVIHRDIKPTNILFDERNIAVISDFGLARIATITTSGVSTSLSGTPVYMSPEQCADGQIDGRSDQYGLAVLVFEALTGQLPFSGEPLQIMYKHVNSDPPAVHVLNSTLPSALSEVLLKALAKSPAARFATVAEFVSALVAVTPPELADLPLSANDCAEPQTPPETASAPAVPLFDRAQLAQRYDLGMKAMNQSDWQEAFNHFDYIVEQDRYFRSALRLRREMERRLQASASFLPTVAPVTDAHLASPESQSLARNTPALSSPDSQSKIVVGAGGAARAEYVQSPKKKRSTLTLVLAFILLGILTAFVFWSRSSTAEEGQAAIALAPTVVVETVALSIVKSGTNASWGMGETAVPLPNTGQIDIPIDGGSVFIQSGSDVTQLIMPSGATLYLAPDTLVEFSTVEGLQLIIQHGKLLLQSKGISSIANTFGARASVDNGLMGVIFSQQPFRFDADCLSGSCLLEGDLQGQETLAMGQHSYVGGSGVPIAPDSARYELYTLLSEIVPTPTVTATPTNTPTATATVKPTSTATERPSSTPQASDILSATLTATSTSRPTTIGTVAATSTRPNVSTVTPTPLPPPTEPPPPPTVPPTEPPPPPTVPPTEPPPPPTVPPTEPPPPPPTDVPPEPTPEPTEPPG